MTITGGYEQSSARIIASAGLAGSLMFGGLSGCSSSIDEAPLRYRQQNLNRRYLLPDITVERLQACTDEFGPDIAAADDDSLRVDATVQVDSKGQTHRVIVGGIPDDLPNLAACARLALQDMAVPDLPLRANSPSVTASVPDRAERNELANPAILVEITIMLGEFAAQHGGKAVLYSVSVEVLSAAAIAGAVVYLKNKK